MRFRRVIATALLTAVTAGSVSQAILPSSQDNRNPAADQAATQQYAEDHRGGLDAARTNSRILADAINSDHLTPSALSPDRRAADRLLRSRLRRP